MQEINIPELLKIRAIRENYFPPKDNIVFTIEEKNIGSLQNYVTFAGLPKTGKSTFMSSSFLGFWPRHRGSCTQISV